MLGSVITEIVSTSRSHSGINVLSSSHQKHTENTPGVSRLYCINGENVENSYRAQFSFRQRIVFVAVFWKDKVRSVCLRPSAFDTELSLEKERHLWGTVAREASLKATLTSINSL